MADISGKDRYDLFEAISVRREATWADAITLFVPDRLVMAQTILRTARYSYHEWEAGSYSSEPGKAFTIPGGESELLS